MRRGPVDGALAVVGDRLATDLIDVTDDLAALDGEGFWAVVIPFEGPPVCARFATVRSAVPWPGDRWQGPRPDQWSSSLDQAAFEAGVSDIREAIGRGDVYQVNLTRRLSAPHDPGPTSAGDIAALGAALAAGNPAPYAAVIRVPEADLAVASASPEQFLRREGDRVWSSPIKGTAMTAARLTPKDRAENVMIVDLVRNDLGRVCEFGTVEVPSLCRVEAHPGLVHLVSTVEGRLRPGLGWPELVAATFPPGSVTGAPKVAAVDHLQRLEPLSRGVYCGAVGWVDADAGVGELNVAIRTFWLEDGRLHFGTGGGITWDSDPHAEWEETELKARRLLAVASGELLARHDRRPMSSTIWLNGELIAGDRPAISAADHGLLVGDGVFETAKVVDGRAFALRRHLERLRRSAAGLALDLPRSDDELAAGVAAVIDANGPEVGRLRITVTGGPGPLGSARGVDGPTVILATGPAGTWPAAADVLVVPWPRNERSPVAGLKTTSYAENVVALAHAHERGAGEALFANLAGNLCEGTGSNIFVGLDGRLVTPPLSSGCLAGITRDLVLEATEAEEADVSMEDFAQVEEAFLTSSTRDVQPIATVDGHELPSCPGPLTKGAADAFAQLVAQTFDP